MHGDDPQPHDSAELRLEAATMSLYVAVVLLATLTLVSHKELEHQPRVLGIVWGTALGLVVAHVFAFTVAAARASAPNPRARAVIAAQFGGAVVVGVVATVPLILLPQSAELNADRWVLAGFIAVSGYRVARDAGRSRPYAMAAATVVLFAGLLVATLKNALGTH